MIDALLIGAGFAAGLLIFFGAVSIVRAIAHSFQRASTTIQSAKATGHSNIVQIAEWRTSK